MLCGQAGGGGREESTMSNDSPTSLSTPPLYDASLSLGFRRVQVGTPAGPNLKDFRSHFVDVLLQRCLDVSFTYRILLITHLAQ